MIDENRHYIPISKLTIKALNKYNDRGRIAAKQTNKLRDTETGKQLGRKTNRRTCRLKVDERKDKKQKMRPVVLLLLK